jgi:putative intracellular protease/amidase
MRLSIVLFDGVTSLDFIGGYEVLSRIPGMEVEFVAARAGVIAADTRALGVLAWKTFEEVTSTDILYMPGGPGAVPLETDEAFHAWLRAVDATTTWTVGICNGVTVLAAAGLLKGRKATCNWFHQGKLPGYGAEFVKERYHRDGKYVTGAGVSASIDAGLFLAALLAGDALAKTIQLGIEYYPAPPYPERSPEEVAPDILAVIAQFEKSGGAEELKKRPVFEGQYRVVGPLEPVS